MAGSVDALVVGRVIGDMVDMFVPSVLMSVYFGSKHVTNGCDIKPSISINLPELTITGSMDCLYTLVMIDPDAPSPSEPSMREWIHWVVVDIPGGQTHLAEKRLYHMWDQGHEVEFTGSSLFCFNRRDLWVLWSSCHLVWASTLTISPANWTWVSQWRLSTSMPRKNLLLRGCVSLIM